MAERRLPTELIHHPYQPPEGFEAPQPGVFKASTVIFPNTAALHARNWKSRQGYTYGLHGTPTTFMLEERIATLEGGLHTLLTPSGLSAVALVDAALLSSGDEVLIPDNGYGPGKELAATELRGASRTASMTPWTCSRSSGPSVPPPGWLGSRRRAR